MDVGEHVLLDLGDLVDLVDLDVTPSSSPRTHPLLDLADLDVKPRLKNSRMEIVSPFSNTHFPSIVAVLPAPAFTAASQI